MEFLNKAASALETCSTIPPGALEDFGPFRCRNLAKLFAMHLKSNLDIGEPISNNFT